MWKRVTVVTAAVLVLFGAYWLGANAVFLETAEYALSLKEGDFEIRDYPELSLATARIQPNGDDSAFGKLFRFIQGSNSRQEEIAMTTPVFIETNGEEGRMSFVIPEETKRQGIPEPNSAEVTIEERPAIRVAVYRFSGVATEESRKEAFRKLETWVAHQGLEAEGDAIFAYYDAPFVPGPLRRNEVMLQIQ